MPHLICTLAAHVADTSLPASLTRRSLVAQPSCRPHVTDEHHDMSGRREEGYSPVRVRYESKREVEEG